MRGDAADRAAQRADQEAEHVADEQRRVEEAAAAQLERDVARRAREEGEAQRILSLTSHEHMRRAARLLAAIATDEGQLERLRQEAQIELLFALAKDVTHMRGPILR